MSKKSKKKNKTNTKSKKIKFTAEQVQGDVNSWLEANGAGLPDTVKFALSQYLEMSDKLQLSKTQMTSFLVQLRKSLGITPSSEKRSSSAKKKNEKPSPEELAAKRGDHTRLEDWHKDQAKKHKRKAKNIEDRLKKLEEIELTSEEIEENRKESQEYHGRLNLGDGAINPSLESVNESFMEGITPVVVASEVKVKVSEEQIAGREVVDRFSDARERFDFSLVVRKNLLDVEKLVVKDHDGEKIVLSASTNEFGPAGYSVTWGFLSNAAIMVSQYAIPLNRLANMLSSSEKKFTSSMLAKHFQFVASQLLPIYIQLFRDLSTSDILCGDDTSCRVTEVKKHFKKVSEGDRDTTTLPPSGHYASPEESEKSENRPKNPLGVAIGKHLDFVSPYKSGVGAKTPLSNYNRVGP